jgi:hypothetical protein
MKPIITRVKGVSYGNAQKIIKECMDSQIHFYSLTREPMNPADPNAVAVTLEGIYKLGYLPADVARVVAPIIDKGTELVAELVQFNKLPLGGFIGLTVRIVEANKFQVG